MRTNNTITLLAAMVSAAILVSCDPMEPSTYSENFFRVGTVKYKEGKTSIYTDYAHEYFYPRNVSDTAVAAQSGLKENLRVRAWLRYDAVGSMENGVLNMIGYNEIESTRFVGYKPADTLNFYYYFAEFDLSHNILGRDAKVESYIYPPVWNEGHIVNVAPTYFVPQDSDKAEFFLYPLEVIDDTLTMRLYSYIPTCDVSLNPIYTQKLLSLDISSLRDNADNPDEQERRDTILARLDRLGKSRIYVKVLPPDSTRAKNSRNPNGTFNRPVPGYPTDPISIPFDF